MAEILPTRRKILFNPSFNQINLRNPDIPNFRKDPECVNCNTNLVKLGI